MSYAYLGNLNWILKSGIVDSKQKNEEINLVTLKLKSYLSFHDEQILH